MRMRITDNPTFIEKLDRIEEREVPRLANKGGAELNLLGASDEGQGGLADAYIWSEIYSKSRK